MSELTLIAARDHDAMARFYDRHVAMVGRFCAAVCPQERVDEAVIGVFLNFLSRASQAPQDAEPEELLRRAAREVAASRMQPPASADHGDDPVCRVMPELLAARVNGELAGHEGPVVDHLSRCTICQATAARLGQAEIMFPVGSAGEVTEGRTAWLQLAGDPDEDPAVGEHAVPAAGEPTRDSGVYRGPPQPQEHVRARRGGLAAAVRRFATSPDDGESGPGK